MIRNEDDYAQHVNYIHFNPVKHVYVEHAADWAYSSIHRHIAAGMITRDWGWNCETKPDEYGER